jgi:hypothetical protein
VFTTIASTIKQTSRLTILTLALALTLGLAFPASSSAATCSGASCNGKDPSTTGCTANAYMVGQYPVRRTSDGAVIAGVYMQLYYSNTCGTNWMRINKNPYCGNVYKYIAVAVQGGTVETENDKTCGASYTMQVYAPGSTPVQFWANLKDTSGKIKAYAPEQLVR